MSTTYQDDFSDLWRKYVQISKELEETKAELARYKSRFCPNNHLYTGVRRNPDGSRYCWQCDKDDNQKTCKHLTETVERWAFSTHRVCVLCGKDLGVLEE